jgi:hypothetical protein
VTAERASPELRRLIDGYQVSQAIDVAAVLGLADRLADGARSSDELALATSTHADSLYRLLRLLAAVGVLEEREGRRFALTPLGQGLRADADASLAGWADYIGQRSHRAAWQQLLHGIRTGENPFQHAHGADVWEYRAAHPDEGAAFDQAMTAFSRGAVQALVEAYDFSRFGTVVDVGGGRGALLAGLLAAYPAMRGVLFDLPHVVAGTELAGHPRCRIAGGSFFESVPVGGDAYVLRAVLHDWDDDRATAILRTCRAAMGDGAVVLIVERDLGGPNEAPQSKLSDLNMFVGPGGRERTLDEYEQLLVAAGLRLADTTPAGHGAQVIDAAPA